MRVLLVAPRSPWPPYTGDRVRAQMWIDALRDDAKIVLVSPMGDGRSALGVDTIRVRRSPSALLHGIRRIAKGAPFHALVTAPWDWRGALEEAEAKHGTFDVAIVLLTRTDPVVFRHLPARRRILDAIDSAARGMHERAGAATSAAARMFWRADARRAQQLEHDAAGRYDAIVTVAPVESAAFGTDVMTIPMGVDVAPMDGAARRYDFGFWGRFPYFANEEAVRALVDVIWPEIRRQRPSSTLFVGGAEAPRWLRARGGRDGIDVVSPVEDRQAALRQVRVAILPVLRGTGQSLKTLEAAEAGCAIVGTSTAFRGIEELANEAIVEDDLRTLAARAITLIDNGAAELGARLRSLVIAHHDRAQSLERMREIVAGVTHLGTRVALPESRR